MSVTLQVTPAAGEGAEATAAMMLLGVLEAMVVTTTVTTPMEEMITKATTTAMAALLKATMAMVAMEATLLVVSLPQCTQFTHPTLSQQHE